MYLIAGLGNPGKKYKGTRHNIGFAAVDVLSDVYHIELEELICEAITGRGSIAETDVLLAKPISFVNKSGRPIQCLKDKFNIENKKIVVIYDDLDLPLGNIRIKPKGGSGGHKGVSSIIDMLDTNEFGRIRIGIGRPNHIGEVDYVLSPFKGNELRDVKEQLELIPEVVKKLIQRGYNYTMSTYNTRLSKS